MIEVSQYKEWIDGIAQEKDADSQVLEAIITCEEEEVRAYLYKKADRVRREYYGNQVYIRGLIELSNYCKNDCYYCGIRKSNSKVKRYHLTIEEVLSCCESGYALGFRTFVLQGGEDGSYTDEVMCRMIRAMKEKYPDCAVTLSLGERSYESYQALRRAGADRYLLRHETANPAHYEKLHPTGMTLESRMKCLWDLKKLGYQVGSGFMVGSPFQTIGNLIEDIRFLQKLEPAMIGIGPFLPHEETPFRDYAKGNLVWCLNMLAVLRILFPYALIPATTALGTLHTEGREMGIQAGANVVMPNLSPLSVRKLYTLYNDKICTGEEAAEGVKSLQQNMRRIGYEVVSARGDVKSIPIGEKQA